MVRALAGIALAVGAMSCIECNAATLVFNKYVEIRGANVRLGDIAAVEDAGEWASRLADFSLGRVPAVGRTERLKAEQVVRWVRGRFPQLARIEGRGADEVLLEVPARKVPADLLLTKTREALPNGGQQWSLLSSHPMQDLLVPDVPYELAVGGVRTTGKCERAVVQMDAVASGRILGSTLVWFKRDGPSKNDDGLAQDGMESCLGSFHEALAPGQENSHQLEVARMDMVTIEMRGPALSIETTGIALGNAKIGQTVNVRRLGSPEAFSAIVTGQGRVQIAERGRR